MSMYTHVHSEGVEISECLSARIALMRLQCIRVSQVHMSLKWSLALEVPAAWTLVLLRVHYYHILVVTARAQAFGTLEVVQEGEDGIRVDVAQAAL